MIFEKNEKIEDREWLERWKDNKEFAGQRAEFFQLDNKHICNSLKQAHKPKIAKKLAFANPLRVSKFDYLCSLLTIYKV